MQPFRGQLARRSLPEFQTTGRSREDDDEYEEDYGGANTRLLAPGFRLLAPAFTASASPLGVQSPESRRRHQRLAEPGRKGEGRERIPIRLW